MHFAVSLPAFAQTALTVDTRSLRMNDLLTITVDLDGPFASLKVVYVPLQNLEIVGEPGSSSEFVWNNGQVSRRRTMRWRARPLAPGAARVGPLVLNAEGQRETLPGIEIEVLPELVSTSNDAETILRELSETGRQPMFVVSEVEKTSVYAGEPVVVTWWLYNAASIQQWQIVSVPKLDDFWTEERPKAEQPERVYVGDVMVQRLPIRKVTLFPLRSGSLRIGGMAVEAALMRYIRRGPFSTYNGELIEASFTSAPINLTVKPIPPGPPVDAVGDLSLTCESPVQRKNGPVVVRVSLSGVGNVRAANPPRFERPVEGTLQVEGGEVLVSREETSFGMSRQWRYLIFPATSAPMEIPPLSMRVFDPATGQRKALRCDGSFVNAVVAAAPAGSAPAAQPAPPRKVWPFVAGALMLLLGVAIVPRLRRELALRRAVREIVDGATPAEIRARVEQRVHIDLNEQSDRGDAWRALRSLLDAAERERDIAIDADAEIVRRVREVLRYR
ncbi:MAG TPA: BatD family protein [Thermoanaerobaculia bacterium]|nr:BatD family protein [Thermoanaerobaculia bacterium]